jgi:hypothetical protein
MKHEYRGGPPFRCLNCAKVIPILDDEAQNDGSCGTVPASDSVPAVSPADDAIRSDGSAPPSGEDSSVRERSGDEGHLLPEETA